jgi:CRP-like cAMP-binding protein
MRNFYFPLAGTVSLIASTVDGHGLEVGSVGREAMLGAQFIFASPVPTLRGTARDPGVARRVEAGAFRAELARSPALQLGLSRCLAVLMGQISASAACLHFHTVRARLARWMLLALDRTSGTSLNITHKELGRLLGVRRVSITDAAGVLHRLGLIEYKRGTLSVTDRRGLELAACCCYESDRRAYVESLK